MEHRPGPFERFAHWATYWTGSSWAFTLALLAIIIWLFTWPLFNSFDTWQLIINTATTIVTFLMVFLIQRSQNKELMALQIKLNELLAAVKGASNRLIDIEDLSEEEVEALHERYKTLLERAKREKQPTRAHSIEERCEAQERSSADSKQASRK